MNRKRTAKARVLYVIHTAFCCMSQLSGMYFIYTGPGRKGAIIGYAPSAQEAWNDALSKFKGI